MEGELGTLEPGKLADIVVLDHDIISEPAPDFLSTHVVYTIVGGQILYHRGEGFSKTLEYLIRLAGSGQSLASCRYARFRAGGA